MKMPDDEAIGGRLRKARADARLTQEEAAAALGIPRSAVSALETGDRHLTAVELAKCAALYRRPASWFLGDDSGPGQVPPGLSSLVARLSCGDRDSVTRFAEFLAARASGGTGTPAARPGTGESPGPESPAVLLRRAARGMRVLAEAATEGPWRAGGTRQGGRGDETVIWARPGGVLLRAPADGSAAAPNGTNDIRMPPRCTRVWPWPPPHGWKRQPARPTRA